EVLEVDRAAPTRPNEADKGDERRQGRLETCEGGSDGGNNPAHHRVEFGNDYFADDRDLEHRQADGEQCHEYDPYSQHNAAENRENHGDDIENLAGAVQSGDDRG